MNKIIISVLVIVVLAGGYVYYNNQKTDEEIKVTDIVDTTVVDSNTNVKEFTMTSWVENKNGKMAPSFSLNEMRVKKGDTVRINITNTAGSHDFTLDEFGIKKDTPLNELVVIEFVADKVGTFEYYCSKYNHRALGQRGNLIVE